VICFDVSTQTNSPEHRERIAERSTLEVSDSAENKLAIIATIAIAIAATIIGAAFGSMMPSALPMLVSLLGTCGLTLLIGSTLTPKQR
jgi:uncharacterized membrane protein YdfJ with MMPL/SSD domain